MMIKLATTLLGLNHVLYTSAASSCAYLTDVDPVEFSIPQKFVSPDTTMKFVDITPIITRKVSSTPKITITRYSTIPSIQVDEMSGSLIISSSECQEEEDDDTSGAANHHWNWGLAATAAMCWAANPQPASFLLAAAAAVPSLAAAQAGTCSHTVEIVMEGPATYQGAVETCVAEVNEIGHCPDPFPTFPTCDAKPELSCEIAVVGAGAGALYTALRMVDEGKVSGSDVCIFEMTERVGGRLFSLRGLGPDSDLTVDAGGYRTWPEFTPTLHALITEYLGLPMECYDPAQDPCEVYNIIDETGNKAGFATFVEEMMTRLIDSGACFYPYHQLDRLAKVPANLETGSSSALSTLNTELYFANGVKATATTATVLGIPQRPLLNVLRDSNFPDSIMDVETLDALHSVQTVIATKLYLYYPRGHAWWLKLGLTSGSFEFDGDARNMLLAGRYHDGHFTCDDENDLDTCHGFLLAVYANDLSGNKAQFFRRYQRDRPEPVTILSNSDLESAEFLKHAHERLVQYHMYENTNAPYTGFEAMSTFNSVDPPEFGVLSTWNIAIPWAGGAWHTWTELDNVDKAIEPLVDSDLFVVNEAFSLLHGWAEGSLKVADQILEKHFDIPRPWDFEREDLVQVVLQTNSRECVEVEETGSGGGGGGTVSAGGGDASGVLCFTDSALVEMADGSYKRISDVAVGDYVNTGTGHGKGLVTAALVHPVGENTPVAVYHSSDYGALIGTPDHPVLDAQGSWIDFGSMEDVVGIEEYFVDTFYNLEIDGHEPGKSSHSYLVNGITASGLGDSAVLNTKFPRRQIWKDLVADQ